MTAIIKSPAGPWLPPTHTNQGPNINHNIFNRDPDVTESWGMTLLLQITFISIITMTVATMTREDVQVHQCVNRRLKLNIPPL